ncbi:uncharacterized protein LOC133927499 [Phragmites australis]|uniref:uncharacterized protein LOC133927499 n=1 Tax=Phragmites australis TaxID=29695 RepID=UPI002D78CEF7|nr:uncharacterized protein LOC133927499 [Phragmites australis]
MADVLVGSERRVLIGVYGLPAPPPPPPPESLLGRLDQIDMRLRQLEERRRRPAHADDGDVRRAPAQAQHQHTKSLPSALQQHVQLRGTLMDRLNLLESRIRQLTCELDLDGGKAGAGSYAALGSSSSVAPQDPAWSESVPLMEPFRDPAAMCAPDKSAADGSWSAVEILQRGTRQLHRDKCNPPNKVKSLKGAKCACQKEKRNRTSRRWFTVGC